MLEQLLKFLGIETRPTSHAEKIVSAIGAFVGIAAVIVISEHFLSGTAAVMVAMSIGATAVLIFAVPHGALSQPWPVFGGHIVSAVIGVSCTQILPDAYLAGPLAVALSILAMRYLRCVHPPGGATALTAAIGGPEITALGYGFVVTPVLINVLTILASAVIFNLLFSWRAYPVYLRKVEESEEGVPEKSDSEPIEREDFTYALGKIDSFIDINVDDLIKIYELAIENRDSKSLDPSALKLGSYYSNGKHGKEWSVRRIIDGAAGGETGNGSVIYKGVAGAGKYSTGVASMSEFAQWARHEVVKDKDTWRRVSEENSN